MKKVTVFRQLPHQEAGGLKFCVKISAGGQMLICGDFPVGAGWGGFGGEVQPATPFAGEKIAIFSRGIGIIPPLHLGNSMKYALGWSLLLYSSLTTEI